MIPPKVVLKETENSRFYRTTSVNQFPYSPDTCISRNISGVTNETFSWFHQADNSASIKNNVLKNLPEYPEREVLRAKLADYYSLTTAARALWEEAFYSLCTWAPVRFFAADGQKNTSCLHNGYTVHDATLRSLQICEMALFLQSSVHKTWTKEECLQVATMVYGTFHGISANMSLITRLLDTIEHESPWKTHQELITETLPDRLRQNARAALTNDLRKPELALSMRPCSLLIEYALTTLSPVLTLGQQQVNNARGIKSIEQWVYEDAISKIRDELSQAEARKEKADYNSHEFRYLKALVDSYHAQLDVVENPGDGKLQEHLSNCRNKLDDKRARLEKSSMPIDELRRIHLGVNVQGTSFESSALISHRAVDGLQQKGIDAHQPVLASSTSGQHSGILQNLVRVAGKIINDVPEVMAPMSYLLPSMLYSKYAGRDNQPAGERALTAADSGLTTPESDALTDRHVTTSKAEVKLPSSHSEDTSVNIIERSKTSGRAESFSRRKAAYKTIVHGAPPAPYVAKINVSGTGKHPIVTDSGQKRDESVHALNLSKVRLGLHENAYAADFLSDTAQNVGRNESQTVQTGSIAEDTPELLNSADVMANILGNWLKQSIEAFQLNLTAEQLSRYHYLLKSLVEPEFSLDYKHKLNALVLELATALNLKDSENVLITDLTKIFIHTDKPLTSHRAQAGNGDKGRPMVEVSPSGKIRPYLPSVASGSLWDFLCNGVSDSVVGESYDAKTFREKSWINLSGIGTDRSRLAGADILRVLTTIREFDLGEKIQRWLEEYCGSEAKKNKMAIWASMPEYQKKIFEIALLDALRIGNLPEDIFDALICVNDVTPHCSSTTILWSQMSVEVERSIIPRSIVDIIVEGSSTVTDGGFDCVSSAGGVDQLAAWLFEIKQGTKTSYYSYIPGRRAGEFMVHPSREEAKVLLTQEINHELSKNKISKHWIFNALPLEVYHDIKSIFEEPDVKIDDLNPLAKYLYSLFGAKKSPALHLELSRRCNNGEAPFMDNANVLYVQRFKGPANHIRTSHEASQQIYLARFFSALSESVEFLTTPLPGKVSLPLRDWVFRLLIMKNAIMLPRDLVFDTPEGLASATDLVELAIEGRGHQSLNKQIKLRYPHWRAVNGAIWDPATAGMYTFNYMPSSAIRDEEGIWRTSEGEQYIYLNTATGIRVAKVKCQDEQLVIVHSELNGVEPVVMRDGSDTWKLDLDRNYSQDIMKMIRAMVVNTAISPLTDSQLELMLKASETSLPALIDYWRCETLAPHALLVGLRELRSRKIAAEIGKLITEGKPEQLPEQAESLVIARLAVMSSIRVQITDKDSGRVMLFTPQDGELLEEFQITRNGPWNYYLLNAPTDHASPLSLFKLFAERVYHNRQNEDLKLSALMEQTIKLVGGWFTKAENQERAYGALINARRLPAEVKTSIRELIPVAVSTGGVDKEQQLARCIFPTLDRKEIARYDAASKFSAHHMDQLEISGKGWSHLTRLDAAKRLTSARIILKSEEGFGLTRDAENLFYSTLVALDEFPPDTAIVVTNVNEPVIGEFWGPPDAGHIIPVTRTETACGYLLHYLEGSAKHKHVPFSTRNSLERTLAQSLPDAGRLISSVDAHLFDRKILNSPLRLGLISPDDHPALATHRPVAFEDGVLTGPDSENLYLSDVGQQYFRTAEGYWPVKKLGRSLSTRSDQVFVVNPSMGDMTLIQVVNVSGTWKAYDETVNTLTAPSNAKRVFKRLAITESELKRQLLEASWSEPDPTKIYWINGQSFVRNILTYPKIKKSEIVFNRVMRQADGTLELLKARSGAGMNTSQFLMKIDNQWVLTGGLKGGLPDEFKGSPDDYILSHSDSKILSSYRDWELKPGGPSLTAPDAEAAKLRLLRSQYVLFNKAIKALMMVQRSKEARGFSSGDQTTTDDIIKQAYSQAKGMVLGEDHTSESAKLFIRNNVQALKENGVTTLYLEGLVHEYVAKDLDIYNATPPGEKVSGKLLKDLNGIDVNYGRIGSAGSMLNLVETAHAHGFRVIGIDTLASYTGMAAASEGNHSERLILSNFVASNIILNDQKNYPGKWVAMVGLTHMGTLDSLPGMAETLDAVAVRVSDKSEGNPKITLDESAYFYGDTDFSFITRSDVHVKMPTGVDGAVAVPWLAENEYFIEESGAFYYRLASQPDVIGKAQIKWHRRAGHIYLDDCPDELLLIKGNYFRNIMNLMSSLELHSLTLSHGPEVLDVSTDISSGTYKVKLENYMSPFRLRANMGEF